MLRRRVLLSMTLSFCSGVLCAYFLKRYFFVGYIAAAIFGTALVLLGKAKIKRVILCAVSAFIALTYTAALMNVERVSDIDDALISAKVINIEGEGRYIVDDIEVNGDEIDGRARLSLYNEADVLPGQYLVMEGASLYFPGSKEYPGGFDYGSYLIANGTRYAMYSTRASVSGQANAIGAFFYRARQRLSQNIDEIFLDNADIIKALVIGETSDITDEVYETFRVSGTVHVLALSGLHVSALTMALFWICGKAGIRYQLQWLVTTPVLLAYCMLVGFSPSITRAVIMATLMYLAGVRMRQYDTLTSLSFAALVILLINPFSILDAGFILSFGSVFGIAVFTKPVADRLGFIPKPIADLASVSIGAQIAIMPFQIWLYGSVSVYSVLANLIVVPLIGIMLAFGYIASVLGVVLPPMVVGIICAPGYALASFIKFINEICAKLPFSSLNVYDPWVITAVLYFISLILLFVMKRYKIAGICAALCALLLLVQPLILRSDELTLTAYSVGDADASIVSCGEHTIMIDTAETDSRIYSALRSEGIKPDAIFLTHAHNDHAGGVGDIVKHLGIKRVILWVGIENSDFEDEAKASLVSALENGAEIEFVKAGDVLEVGDMKVSVIAPYARSGDGNRDSLILLVESGEHRLLFMGDADGFAELSVPDMEVDAIKIGHHGSNTSTSSNFLSRISSKYGIISAGRSFGEGSSQNALERMERSGMKLLLTNELKSIRMIFSDDGIRIMHYDGRRWSELDI